LEQEKGQHPELHCSGFHINFILLAASDGKEEASRLPPPIKSSLLENGGLSFLQWGQNIGFSTYRITTVYFLDGIGIDLHLDLELLFLANMIVGSP